ncbi:MAG TPA: hypothetical protein VGJ44_13495 [Kribbellaceae bacterium]
MRIVRSRRRDQFTVVDNLTVRDERLSFRARGLLVYLLSMPPGWTTDHRKLSRHCREGERAVLAALNEMELLGYLVRRKLRDPKTGRWSSDAVVYERPVNPQAGASAQNRDSENRDSETCDLKERRTRKTDTKEGVVESSEPPVRLADASAEGSHEDHYFVNYRVEDRDRFVALIGSDVVELTHPWESGRYATTALYEGWLRWKIKNRPIDWPGRYLEQIADRHGGDPTEWLTSHGIEPA